MSRNNAFQEIVIATCIGAVFFCANTICILTTLMLRARLLGSHDLLFASLALLLATYFTVRGVRLRFVGAVTLTILSLAIAFLNFLFIGLLMSSL